jgi:hypothetical protein
MGPIANSGNMSDTEIRLDVSPIFESEHAGPKPCSRKEERMTDNRFDTLVDLEEPVSPATTGDAPVVAIVVCIVVVIAGC